jgi:transcription termination/antitermination protein NusA
LIGRALSPAEVSNIILNEQEHEATVVVNEDQLSKAIGKEGKNVRLAAKLTDWKIDLVSSREFHIRQRVRSEIRMDLEEMNGVSDKLAVTLRQAGYDTISAVARADQEALLELPGIGPKTVESLQATAAATMDELERIIATTVAEELAQAETEERPLFDEDILSGEAEPVEEAPEAEKLENSDELFADFEDKVSEMTDEPQDKEES